MERPVTIAKTSWILTISSIAVVVASLYLAKAILIPLAGPRMKDLQREFFNYILKETNSANDLDTADKSEPEALVRILHKPQGASPRFL